MNFHPDASMFYKIHMTTFGHNRSEIKGIHSKTVLVPHALNAMAFVIIQHPGTFKQSHVGSEKLILIEIGCQGFVGMLVSVHLKGKIVHSKMF